MNNTVKTAAALALLVAAVVIWYVRRDPPNEIGAMTKYNSVVKCRACGKEEPAQLEIGKPPPWKCSGCGKTEVWRCWRCNACGHHFVPDPVGDPPHPPVSAPCPKCKSGSTGGVPVES